MGIGEKIVWAALLPLCLAVRGEAETRVTVTVDDYAGVTPGALGRAEKVAASIFHRAGIEMVWHNRSRSETGDEAPKGKPRHFDSSDITLRILSRRMALRLGPDGSGVDFSLGMAQPGGERGLGSLVYIYFHRIQKLARPFERHTRTEEVILGHAVVHEIGHLLLNTPMHSAAGIMHVPWDKTHLARALEGLLVFTPAEAERMQANFRALARPGSRPPEEGKSTKCSSEPQ